ncbi:MAG: hypothetical protein BGO41_13970 [Clostridiales bacterium 38-18]|nr:MAG: hypothetical protein BGO41_13970 [Clostridiales bacterium 38-18]
MYSKINTAVSWGIEGLGIKIETHILRGMPNHILVGLPSTVIKESKERVRSAIKSIGVKFSDDRIVQNLYPADLKKEGSHLDLPLAIGILACTEVLNGKSFDKLGFIGELALNGDIQPISNVLSLIEGLVSAGISHIVMPYDNRVESRFINNVTIYPYSTLQELVADLASESLKKEVEQEKYDFIEFKRNESEFENDYNEVYGQGHALRAMEIAMLGRHNLLLIGPPGCGKSMIAERIPSIMPPLSINERIELTKIYGVADGETKGMIKYRPFRSPHHSISKIGLVGGGMKVLPGEISKAHNGVLFLDEIGEFKKDAIESLREPLSSGKVQLSRGGRSLEYPSQFMLVATMNPCPCGHFLSKSGLCNCKVQSIKNYMGKLSWPILDRIDMTVLMDAVDLSSELSEGKSSQFIFQRVEAAGDFKRERTSEKMRNQGQQCELGGEFLNQTSIEIIKRYEQKGKLSMRSVVKLVKIARSIADLEQSLIIEKKHIFEAYTFLSAQVMKKFFI